MSRIADPYEERRQIEEQEREEYRGGPSKRPELRKLEDLEKRIREIHTKLSDRCWGTSIKESDRLIILYGRVETPYTGNARSDEHSLSSRTSITSTGWEVIDYTLDGLEICFRKVSDMVLHTELLIDYIETWAARATYYQGSSQPPMTDFIKYDDYISRIYKDYQVGKLAITPPKQQVKPEKKGFAARDRVFRTPKGEAVKTGYHFTILPYKSRIDLFPASVWVDSI